VRDALADINTPSTPTVNRHCPKVDIQDLREAERSFHLSRTVRRCPEYATGVQRRQPQAARRTTDRLKNQYRSSQSRPR